MAKTKALAQLAAKFATRPLMPYATASISSGEPGAPASERSHLAQASENGRPIEAQLEMPSAPGDPATLRFS